MSFDHILLFSQQCSLICEHAIHLLEWESKCFFQQIEADI